MRVLITGAGGFIGSHLVDDQLKRGNQVTAVDINVDRLQSLSSNPGVKIIEADFANQPMIDPELGWHEICFHLASAHLETGVGEDYFWKVNVDHTREFVERCHKAGIKRFVHCSSVGVYGDIKNPPADEESECHPNVPYERSKLAGEAAVRDYVDDSDYEVVIVRPAWVYGPRDLRTEKLFWAVKKGRFFYVGSGHTFRHPIYITDMVEGFEMAAKHKHAPGNIFIMAGPKPVTLEELASGIAESVDVKPPSLRLPHALVWSGVTVLEAAARITGRKAAFSRRSMKFYTGNTAFSINKAEQVIGFVPKIGLKEGLDMTADWLMENNRI
ncbi:NAD-dependent epimerase/dehydratase family protein [Chloroflexota bacterium]